MHKSNWAPTSTPPLDIYKFTDKSTKFGVSNKNSINHCDGFAWQIPWENNE